MSDLFKQFYLLTYNTASLLGWALVLYNALVPTSQHLLGIIMDDHGGGGEDGGGGESADVPARDWYEEAKVEQVLIPVQTAAVLEILNSAIGLVRSPVMTTALQVISRLTICWPVWYLLRAPSAMRSYAIPLTLFPWALVELIRYAYYGLLQLRIKPHTLTWLRYSVFLILYPLGICGEVASIWHSLGVMKEAYFGMYILFWTILLLYIPGGYVMYTHMLRLRRKHLGGSVAATTTTTSTSTSSSTTVAGNAGKTKTT